MKKILQDYKQERPIEIEEPKHNDTLVKRISYDTEYDEEGNEIKKRKETNINITKLINETKKLIKNYSAEEKLDEMKRIFSK